MRMIIKNGFIVDGNNEETPVNILLGDGVILEIGENLDYEHIPTVDAEGGIILPGLIDMNCDICDPGYENKEDLASVSKSAAKGGFTSITASPVTNPVVDNKTVVNYIITKSARQSIVNTYIYGSMTAGCNGEKMAEIGEMVAAGIKAVSDGHKSVMDASLMLNIMSYSKMFDIPVITMCEDRDIAKGGVMNMGAVATANGLKGIPAAAEEAILARNIILAKTSGCRLHISEISTKGSVYLIRRAKELGINITCETQPHYFTLTEDCLEGYNTFAKVNPPLRAKDDADAIIEGLCDGTVDIISSGHSPQTLESKNMEFDMASFGISSLETAFPMAYNALVASGKMSVNSLVEKMSKAPAKILKLKSK
ncbi:MAG: dihydroorotase, partial [Clostridiales bacterium]|nr:dihydroorotase [Clostridiales bacterium]